MSDIPATTEFQARLADDKQLAVRLQTAMNVLNTTGTH